MPTDAQAQLPKKAAKDTPAIRQYTVTLGLPDSQQREADAGHKHIGRAPRKRRMCKRIGCCGNQAVRGGDPDFCTAHGGGRRCQQEGCTKGARDTADFCIAHGGGRRCQLVAVSELSCGSS